MDPASYSDAPVGGWGSGIDTNKKTKTGGGSHQSAPSLAW